MIPTRKNKQKLGVLFIYVFVCIPELRAQVVACNLVGIKTVEQVGGLTGALV